MSDLRKHCISCPRGLCEEILLSRRHIRLQNLVKIRKYFCSKVFPLIYLIKYIYLFNQSEIDNDEHKFNTTQHRSEEIMIYFLFNPF